MGFAIGYISPAIAWLDVTDGDEPAGVADEALVREWETEIEARSRREALYLVVDRPEDQRLPAV